MAEIISCGRLIVTYLALSLLVLDNGNPRQHSSRQIRQIARSIEVFGFVVPILIDCRNRIVAGHGRYLAAQLLGMDVVPVIRLEHLTKAQAKALSIADNRLTELSLWNSRLLAEALKELSELDLDFSIEATGFTVGEIDLQIEGLAAMGDGQPAPADQLPIPTSQFATSKSGDLWHLGRHALRCGNALSVESFHTLLGPKRAQNGLHGPSVQRPDLGARVR
jgi:ParB-like chromosome segregation protein Spo0J